VCTLKYTPGPWQASRANTIHHPGHPAGNVADVGLPRIRHGRVATEPDNDQHQPAPAHGLVRVDLAGSGSILAMVRTTFALIVAALACCAGAARAEESPEGWLIPFACAFEPDIAGINSIFARHNLPQAGSRLYGWGCEIRSLTGRNLLFGPLFFTTWNEAGNDSFQLRSDVLGLMAEAGLKLQLLDFLTVVPMLGLGGVRESFTLRKRTGPVNIDSLLAAPGQNATISPGFKATGLAALELGLAFNTQAGRFGLALRGGYVYSPLELVWRLANGSEVTGVPRSLIRGPFYSVGILLLPAAQTTQTYP